ncbi:MAG: hypothetical protein PHI27_13145 [Eubacteriales bacterium]|nr:hypothetical protein [Eubacteriales bacterium]MDD3883169.1 hypothetical protein [Eubacteriales bacterium]MDD4512448.1 hypothetical protein [Eubacteriales bacterium]
MNKNSCKKVTLGKGEMYVYDFGSVKLHAYKTNDLINDEVFIVEKSGKAVIIEAPCFFDNIAELTAYIADEKLEAVGMLLAYHMAGASFLPGVPVYATANADEYGHTGGGAALIRQFTGAFGGIFDSSIYSVTNVIEAGKQNIGGIEFIITKTGEAFDIEIPEINAVYTHMMGHDCHSIVAGEGHADGILAQLSGYMSAGYDLVLTSHYTPEDLKDAKAKADYIRKLKEIAEVSANAGEFKAAVKAKYPEYSGENYLDMTAGFFLEEH